MVKTPANQVTLFSNGIAHFRRVYNVGKEQKLSIPFKKEHIGDVLSSFSVFGPVKYTSTPSFLSKEENGSLEIEPSSLEDMLVKLSGSEVMVSMAPGFTNTYPGVNGKIFTLIGTDNKLTSTPSGNVYNTYVVLNREGKIYRVLMDHVESVDFKEAAVQAEIAKALKNNFQKIKPDSTFLDLSLTPIDETKEATAVVQYTNPVAAWKMRYNIRSDKDKFFLEGSAIVDNNTDEDWDNFSISVVTGNPISFGTDIADVVVPNRKKVSLVDQETIGNVVVESATPTINHMARSTAANTKTIRSKHAADARMSQSYQNAGSFGFASAAPVPACSEGGDMGLEGARYETIGGAAAESAGVESKEVGDFCVFTSKNNISLASKRSAVVPMFETPLESAGVILMYKEENNTRRPFRALKFKNETDYSLGRGKVVIYQDGVFQGDSVLEMAKPGDQRLLPHCLENGVKVTKKYGENQYINNSLSIASGVMVTETVQMARTSYVIENKKKEKFNFMLEHNKLLRGSNATMKFEGIDIVETETLSSGMRVYFFLEAGSTIELKVEEREVMSSDIAIGNNFGYVNSTLSNFDESLTSHPSLKECVSIQEKITKNAQDLQKYRSRLTALKDQSTRVQANLTATSNVANNDTVASWVQSLNKIEDDIQNITNVLMPESNELHNTLSDKLLKAMAKLTLTWKKVKDCK